MAVLAIERSRLTLGGPFLSLLAYWTWKQDVSPPFPVFRANSFIYTRLAFPGALIESSLRGGCG